MIMSAEKASEEYLFRRKHGKIHLTKYIGKGGCVEIPQFIDGLPVTSIEWNTFYEADVSEVIIPDGVRCVDNMAFAYCKSLKKITLQAETGSVSGTARVLINDKSATDPSNQKTHNALWTTKSIEFLFHTMMAGSDLYRRTISTHSCILMRKGEILCSMDDIGRHNAFDKVVGWALLREIPLNECIVFSSGRIPVDMVQKAVRAGVTVLASKALPTMEAITLAEQKKLTLLHCSHCYGLLQFTHRNQIE